MRSGAVEVVVLNSRLVMIIICAGYREMRTKPVTVDSLNVHEIFIKVFSIPSKMFQ